MAEAIGVGVGAFCLYFLIPWAEYAFYWWRAPSYRVTVLERALKTARSKHARLLQTSKTLPERRPKIAPVRYGHGQGSSDVGIIFKNEGEPAYDVTVPDVKVEGARLFFEGHLNYLASSDEMFCRVYVEEPDGIHVDVDFDGLIDFMRRQNLREANLVIYYRDFDHRWYATQCTLLRGAWFDSGIGIGSFKQTRVDGPPTR